jgi:crossover junction endodeoxyribonuclease RuvC
MTVLGIDPGLASTGWGLIDATANRNRYIAHGVVHTSPKLAVGARLVKLYSELTAVIEEYAPEEAGVESLYFARNATSAIPVAQARGVVLLALFQHGVVANEYPPQAIKQSIVGTGRAEKQQVQELVRILLGLESVPKPDHASDALAAAICHVAHRGLEGR